MSPRPRSPPVEEMTTSSAITTTIPADVSPPGSFSSTQVHTPPSPCPVVPMPVGKGKKRALSSPVDPTPIKRVDFGSTPTPVVIVSRRPRVRSTGLRLRRSRRRYTAQLASRHMSPVLAASPPTDSLPVEDMDTTEANSPISPTYLFDWRLTLQDDSFNFGRRGQVQSLNGAGEFYS